MPAIRFSQSSRLVARNCSRARKALDSSGSSPRRKRVERLWLVGWTERASQSGEQRSLVGNGETHRVDRQNAEPLRLLQQVPSPRFVVGQGGAGKPGNFHVLVRGCGV